MLYNLNWLQKGRSFPPSSESARIERYVQNASLFDGEHFADTNFRSPGGYGTFIDVYRKAASRIQRVVGNFEEVISFPTLLNYQRLMTLKMADLVCGEIPSVTASTDIENESLRDCRDSSEFDRKLFETVIDLSRYGDAIWRIYKDEGTKRSTFTVWSPTEWIPIIRQDGTKTIQYHCIAWRENLGEDNLMPDWYLHVQVHGTDVTEFGKYTYYKFKLETDGCTIGTLISRSTKETGLGCCAVTHLKSYSTTNTVFGYDDYVPLDSILAEIMVRVGQIAVILDKHSNPNLTGPISMLKTNPETGLRYLETGSFFATSPGDNEPKYLTWDGQLDAAFRELDKLLDQMYILSEMGAAVLGGTAGSNQAISGTAMRFKMVNPLAKARRVTNSLTLPVRSLFEALSEDSPKGKVERINIGIGWYDGLPDDPRENIENAKLATGATKMMPLHDAIMEYFGRSSAEAERWLSMIDEETKVEMERIHSLAEPDPDDPNKPGPQDGTGVNSSKKGSKMGLKSFHSETNKDSNS